MSSLRTLPASNTAIEEALKILRDGGIVAHATETCYGFACDLTNPNAVVRLFTIKQRPADQPVSALFPSVDEAKRYVEWNERAEELAKKFLPGPLTLILPIHPDAPCKLFLTQQQTTNSKQRANQLTSKRANERIPANELTIGIRVSSHTLATQLALKFGRPLSTTSANLHGKPNPYSAEEIVEQYRREEFQPDLILDSGALAPTSPSTVMDLTDENLGTRRKGEIAIQ
jgi:L-threonylcarbamoyladenylate synthase